MKWTEIDVIPTVTSASTEPLQPLHGNDWPLWAKTQPEFSAAWITQMDGLVAATTSELSTSSGVAYIDYERRAAAEPYLRYYRYVIAILLDGRIMQSSPLKNVEYGHHHNYRPAMFSSCGTTTIT